MDPAPLPPPPAEGWKVGRDPKNNNKFFYITPPLPDGKPPVKIDKPSRFHDRLRKYIGQGHFNPALLQAMPFSAAPGKQIARYSLNEH